MSDKIIVKGKLVAVTGLTLYQDDIKRVDGYAAIKLSPQELAEQCQGHKILHPNTPEEEHWYMINLPQPQQEHSKQDKDGNPIWEKPQQIITNILCDTCQLKHYYSDCPSRENVTVCDKYKPVCDCKPHQEFCECFSPFPRRIDKCNVCGKPIRPEPNAYDYDNDGNPIQYGINGGSKPELKKEIEELGKVAVYEGTTDQKILYIFRKMQGCVDKINELIKAFNNRKV